MINRNEMQGSRECVMRCTDGNINKLMIEETGCDERRIDNHLVARRCGRGLLGRGGGRGGLRGRLGWRTVALHGACVRETGCVALTGTHAREKGATTMDKEPQAVEGLWFHSRSFTEKKNTQKRKKEKEGKKEMSSQKWKKER